MALLKSLWLAALSLYLSHVSADTTTTLNPSATYGDWEGWGVSLAWWGKAFGNDNILADVFFTLDSVLYNQAHLPGLGFNIVRYNAGATSFNTISSGQRIVESPDINPARLVDALWIDPRDSSTSSTSWNWTADANQRNLLQLAKARGANVFELFSNSPVWWQCVNHNPSGSNDGISDNLQPSYYQQHAYYLAAIARYARDNWGINFRTVEAFNEPISAWWNGQTGTQEGCHFDVSTQATLIGELHTQLQNLGLEDVVIAASDENTYDLAIRTWNGLGSTAQSQVGQINVHGYQGGSGQRDVLYSIARDSGKALWNSEYGDGDATGSDMVSNLILDFRWLHPSAWIYWQAIDGDGWGLIDGDDTAVTTTGPTQKYFLLAQFSRHIRPGFQILESGSDYTVAGYDASTRMLVIVAVNWGDAQYINFELGKFGQPSADGTLVPRWSTQIESGAQYVGSNDTFVRGSKFWSWFESREVQTFEVPGVVI